MIININKHNIIVIEGHICNQNSLQMFGLITWLILLMFTHLKLYETLYFNYEKNRIIYHWKCKDELNLKIQLPW